MDNLTVEQIASNLRRGEYQCQEKKDGKSDVWINFEEIIDMQKQLIGFIICKNCEHILKYDYKTGILILKHHRYSDEKQQKITSI